MPLYRIEAAVYVEAHDVDTARALAELAAINATASVRKKNSWVQDKTTLVHCEGSAVEIQRSTYPAEWYDKGVITKVFGEDRGGAQAEYMADV